MTYFAARGSDLIEELATEFDFPASDGLVGLFFTNGSISKALKNVAPGDGHKDATVVGAPAAMVDRVGLVGLTSYLQTAIAETAASTYMVVAAAGVVPTAAHRCPIIGNATGRSAANAARQSVGHSLSYLSGTQITQQCSRVLPDGSPNFLSLTLSVADTAVPRLIVSRLDDTRRRLDILTGAVSQTAAARTNQRDPGVNRIRLGSTYDAGYDQLTNLQFAAIWARYIGDDEMTAGAACVRAYFTRKFGLAL